jgi:uncharacterized membrane protein
VTSIMRGLARGAAAGAAGATALTATGGIALARRGATGPAEPAPTGPLAPLGPLAGPTTAVVVGGLAGVLRAAGVRVPTAVGGPVLGAVGLLAGAGPLAVPRGRRGAAAAGLLLYGLVTHATLVAVSRVAEQRETVRPPEPAVLLRAAALGAASGSRSTAGFAALAATSTRDDRGAVAGRLGSPAGTVLSSLAAAGELVGDKLPGTPARTALPVLLPRAAAGAIVAGGMATRDGDDPAVPAVIGLVTAVAAALLAVRARAAAAERFGSDRPGAFAEDALAGLLGWLGARRAHPPVDTTAGLRR